MRQFPENGDASITYLGDGWPDSLSCLKKVVIGSGNGILMAKEAVGEVTERSPAFKDFKR